MAEDVVAAEVAAPSESVEAPASEANWTDGLNEASQGFVENKGWKSADQMLDSYQNLEKTMGVPADQVLRLPKEGDSEGWGSVYNRLGRPEEPSGYKLNEVEVPDGGVDLTSNLREWAHEAGLSQEQAAKIYDNYNARLGEVTQEIQAQKAEQSAADEQSLRKEWGNAWEENIAAGVRFRQRFGLDDAMVDKLEDALGLRGLLELSASIGRGLGEHSMPTGAEDGGESLPFGMTPAAAKAKIADLTLDKDFMDQYMDGRKEAVARMTRLHSIAHPDVADS
jgi:hypothetical protein